MILTEPGFVPPRRWQYPSLFGSADIGHDERRFLRQADEAPSPSHPSELLRSPGFRDGGSRPGQCLLDRPGPGGEGKDRAARAPLDSPASADLPVHLHPRHQLVAGVRCTHVRRTLAAAGGLPGGAHFIAAHNASFDAGVLRACCEQAGLRPPSQPFVCTVQVARRAWNLRPTKLPDVCRHLGLPLRHHDALSDAEACANIVLAAAQDATAGFARGR